MLLTALVCWLFLGSLSSTLNVVLAIPMSLLGTVAVIYFLGFTLNTFTLLGLSLAVGIVVDDAIMVMENIYRHAEMGKDRVRAAREGTAEITFAALAATLAVVAIFFPVVFMKGVIGKFFFQFGVTLCVAVLLSYFEAITLAPARCAQILSHVAREPQPRGPGRGPRLRRGSSAVYALDAAARPRAAGLGASARAAVLFVGARSSCCARCRPSSCPRRTRAGSWCACRPRSARTSSETDQLFQRAEDVRDAASPR